MIDWETLDKVEEFATQANYLLYKLQKNPQEPCGVDLVSHYQSLDAVPPAEREKVLRALRKEAKARELLGETAYWESANVMRKIGALDRAADRIFDNYAAQGCLEMRMTLGEFMLTVGDAMVAELKSFAAKQDASGMPRVSLRGEAEGTENSSAAEERRRARCMALAKRIHALRHLVPPNSNAYYMINIRQWVMRALWDREKKRLGEPPWYAASDAERLSFELGMLRDEVLEEIEQYVEEQERGEKTAKAKATLAVDGGEQRPAGAAAGGG